MEDAFFELAKLVIISGVILIFSLFINDKIFDLVKAIKTGTEKQIKRESLGLIFFVIFLLTMYVYSVRFFLFR